MTVQGPGRALRLVSLASLVLSVGILVYLADRPAGASQAAEHWFGAAGEWLPSLSHTLAFSLLTAAALPNRARWGYIACAFWCAVNLAFECGQHPLWNARLGHALHDSDSGTARALANYFARGTFDTADLAATVVGALLAGAVLRWLRA